MDQIKIGKFIAETRKEQGMTQKQLSEHLNISDKTVSKWECGNGLPDNAILLELCEVLGISVNELLSGERLSVDTYHKMAEENMIQLIHKSKKEERGRKWSFIALLIETYCVILMIILSSGGISGIVNFLDFPSLFAILAITFLVLTLAGSTKDFFRVFRITIRGTASYTEKDLQNSLNALRLALISIPLSGCFFTLIGVVSVLAADLSATQLSANLAVATLSVLYSIVLDFILLPIEARLKKLLS